MARERTFKSVTELLKGMGLSRKTVNAVEDKIEQSTIARELVVRRTKANLTQKELAKRMGVSERTIARIENADNDVQKMGDIKAFANALGYRVFLHFEEK